VIDPPRERRQVEIYVVVCWRCRRTVELPADARPYQCFHCGALLVIESRSVRSPLCAACAASDPPARASAGVRNCNKEHLWQQQQLLAKRVRRIRRSPTGSASRPRSVVGGCCGEVAAEVSCGDWAPTLQKMGFRPPHKRGRHGDARVLVCEQHIADEELNRRLGRPRWQRLFDHESS